jgi:hypothetical protein
MSSRLDLRLSWFARASLVFRDSKPYLTFDAGPIKTAVSAVYQQQHYVVSGTPGGPPRSLLGLQGAVAQLDVVDPTRWYPLSFAAGPESMLKLDRLHTI